MKGLLPVLLWLVGLGILLAIPPVRQSLNSIARIAGFCVLALVLLLVIIVVLVS